MVASFIAAFASRREGRYCRCGSAPPMERPPKGGYFREATIRRIAAERMWGAITPSAPPSSARDTCSGRVLARARRARRPISSAAMQDLAVVSADRLDVRRPRKWNRSRPFSADARDLDRAHQAHVIDDTTSSRASFSFTLLRTISLGLRTWRSPGNGCYCMLQFHPHSREPAHAQPRRACRPHPDRADFSSCRESTRSCITRRPWVHAEGRPALPRTAPHRLRDHRNRRCAGDMSVEDALGGGPPVPVDDPRSWPATNRTPRNNHPQEQQGRRQRVFHRT